MQRRLLVAAGLLLVVVVHCVSAVGSECERDPNSQQCHIEKDRTLDEQAAQKRIDRHSADYKDLSKLVAQLEDLCHHWCCAATGVGLYGVHGDKDVFNFVYTLLSQTLKRFGQEYGAELVTQFLVEREEAPVMECSVVSYGDANHYNNLMEAVLQLKELVATWLRRNEVDPAIIIGSLVPQARTLLGRWGVARLLVHKNPNDAPSLNKQHVTVPVEQVPLSVLPLLEGEDDAAEERCAAASQLTVMYREQKSAMSSEALKPVLERLLAECYENGRVSSQPSTFGEHLLDAGHTEKARELFDLAVQRGTLCNPYQRPDMLLRKDLTPLPVWSLTSFPPAVLKGFMGLQDALAEAVQRPNFMFSNDTETMNMFLATGTWERTIIYAAHTWQEFNCQQLGEATCAKTKRLVETITDSNDAYGTQCNGSLSIDIWRMSHDMTSNRAVGNSNIVLQLLMPLVTHDNTLLLNVGEEAVKVDAGEAVVIDDSFENYVQVSPESNDEDDGTFRGTNEGKPIIVLHAQLCHPDFHERALDLPSKKCKKIRS